MKHGLLVMHILGDWVVEGLILG